MIPLATRLLATASADPLRPALVQGTRRTSYGELAHAAMQFAALLTTHGTSAGQRVAIVLPNCIEAVVAWYGAWLAGAIVVPLNVQARARDIGPWLRHADAQVLVHETGNLEIHAAVATLPSAPLRIGVGDDASADALAWDSIDMFPAHTGAGAARDATAAVLYTSGTTGAPKGVTLTQANFAANTDAITHYLELSRDDSIAAILPFYYSYGASVLHSHLAVGARLVIETNLVFPQVIVETMARERVSGFAGVPSTYAMLLDRVVLADHDLSSLRYLTQAGGAMSTALTRRVRDAFPRTRLFVMYGQTEATARLTWLPPERLDDKPGSVGLAVADTRIEVRNESGEALPPGNSGEIWAHGPGVMAGYWCDPPATASVLHDGWLRTGDMGHVDADGFLHLAGRRSDMIKTGAHRVHPLDVEEAIAELDGVAEVAVAGIDDATLGQSIKAFVVRANGAELGVDQIKAHCRAHLAGYKIPRQVAFVASLPKTASGKIRRTLLTDPSANLEAS